MASLGKKIAIAIFGKKKEVKVQLDPESVKANHIIEALAKENAQLKGDKARQIAEESREREKSKDLKEEDEVKLFLNKEKKEIQTKHYPKYFSLRSLFRKMFIEEKRKRGKRFFITSFNREKKIAKLGDIGFSSDGDIVLLDKDYNVVLKMKNLNDIFQSVGGLGTDAENYMLPVNLDNEGGYVENVMVYEASELVPTKDGRLKFSKARKRPVYELLRDYGERMSGLQQDLEMAEKINTDLQNKIDDLERANRIHENRSQTLQTEFSKAEQRQSAVERVFGESEKELIALRNMREINEEDVEKLNREVQELRLSAEREGVKLSDDKALEMVMNIKRHLIKDMPKEISGKPPEMPENQAKNP